MNRFIKKSIAALSASFLALSALSIPAFAAGPVTYTNVAVAATASADGYEATVTGQANDQAAGHQVTIAVFKADEPTPFDVMDANHIDQFAYDTALNYHFHLGMSPIPGKYIAVIGGTNATPTQVTYETNVTPPPLEAYNGNPTSIKLNDPTANTKFNFNTVPGALPTYFYSEEFGSHTAKVQINGGAWVDAPCWIDGSSLAVDIADALKGASAGNATVAVTIKAVGYTDTKPVTSNVTLTVPVVAHTVTFDPAGGTLNSPATVQVNDGATVGMPANPTKSGYTFVDWFLNGAHYNFGTPVTSDITLTAQWATGYVPPEKITMSAEQTSLNMKVGTKLALKITINPPGADPNVTWTSSNPAVATVDPVTGVVTALKTGSVRVTVKSNADPTVSYMFLVMINA